MAISRFLGGEAAKVHEKFFIMKVSRLLLKIYFRNCWSNLISLHFLFDLFNQFILFLFFLESTCKTARVRFDGGVQSRINISSLSMSIQVFETRFADLQTRINYDNYRYQYKKKQLQYIVLRNNINMYLDDYLFGQASNLELFRIYETLAWNLRWNAFRNENNRWEY